MRSPAGGETMGWVRQVERLGIAVATRTGWPASEIYAFPLRRLMRQMTHLTGKAK